MKEQENFDDLIRQKFAEKEFVFNEENWEKAEKKIDSTRRFSKIFLWTSIFIIGLFVGVGITLLFVGNENNENKKSISEIKLQPNNKTESLNKENTSVENPNSSISPIKENQNNSTSQKTDEKEITAEAESTSIKNEDQKIEKTVTTPINKNIQAEELTNKNAKNLPPAALKDSKKETIKTKKENKLSTAEAKLMAQKTISTTKQIPKNLLKESEEPVNDILEKAADNSMVIENKQVNNSAEISINNQSEINSQNSSSDRALSPVVQDKEPVNVSKLELEVVTHNTEQKINADTNSSSLTEIILPEKEIVIAKVDSSIVPNENKLVPPPPSPLGGLASATFVSVDAGTNFELGWKYPEASEAGGFNPILGIGITHFINQKLSLLSGVEYGSIAYLKASQKVFTSTTYGFGSTSVDKVINTKTLHYAIVPLLFQYHFNDKNTISIGGSISYLVNAKSKVTINTTTIAPMVLDSNQTGPVENQIISTQSTETGYYSTAFNKWDASLALGYRRRLSQKISVAAIANFGLLDVKDNTFFLRDQFERNVGLKLIISYNLFEF